MKTTRIPAVTLTLLAGVIFALPIVAQPCDPVGCFAPAPPPGPLQSSCGGSTSNCTSTIDPNGRYHGPGEN